MEAGQLLDARYQLISRLGAGGMGSVWLARDLRLEVDVAVKLIRPELVSSAEALARFRREARVGAALRGNHVAHILDYGAEPQKPYIVMELLRGESLSRRLQRETSLPPSATLAVLSDIAHALAMAHARNIVHRDLKPDNIFLVTEGDRENAKVLDFGIAHRDGPIETGGVETRTGAILGTAYYMSPEQAGGEDVDELTDVWAFGVIACECLTGLRPFQGNSFRSVLRAICIEEAPSPSALGAVPKGFDEWFACCTARDKRDRFQTIQDAASALKAVCSAPRGSIRSGRASAMRVANALSAWIAAPGLRARQTSRPALSGAPTSSSPGAVEVFDRHASAPPPTSRRHTRRPLAFGAAAISLLGIAMLGFAWARADAASPREATPAGSNKAPAVSPQPTLAVTEQLTVSVPMPTPEPTILTGSDVQPLRSIESVVPKQNAGKPAFVRRVNARAAVPLPPNPPAASAAPPTAQIDTVTGY